MKKKFIKKKQTFAGARQRGEAEEAAASELGGGERRQRHGGVGAPKS